MDSAPCGHRCDALSAVRQWHAGAYGSAAVATDVLQDKTCGEGHVMSRVLGGGLNRQQVRPHVRGARGGRKKQAIASKRRKLWQNQGCPPHRGSRKRCEK